MTRKRSLRVLICSGNLGNARPDEDSIAEWLPCDGCFTDVKDSTAHPLPRPKEHRALLNDLGLSHFQVYEETLLEENANASDDDSVTAVNDANYFDIIVIGMQEATFEVEPNDPVIRVPVLHPLKKTVVKAVEAGVGALDSLARSKNHIKEETLIFGTSVNPLEWLAKEDSKVLQELFRKRLPSYDFSVRYQRGEMRLEILVRNGLDVDVLSVKAQNTGIGVNGLLNAANKGGIVAELLVEQHTRISFCTAHLQAHEGREHYLNRIRMAEVIFDGTADEITGISLDLAIKSHICFMLGDLNFRNELEGDYTNEQQDAHVRKMVADKNWRGLNQTDELFRAIRDKDCFVGFETLPCYFPPTFKLEREAGFRYKDQRRPSYTDRILWRSLSKLETNIKPIVYEPIDNFTSSDHKPIRGAFEIELNQPINLARAGLMRGRMLSSKKIRSAMSLFLTTDDTIDSSMPPLNTLHILVSNIKCGLKQRTNLSAQLGPPDPYVLFISLPEKLVRIDDSRFERFKGLFRLGANLHLQTKKKGGKTTRTASGFPRTKKLAGTYNPDWGEEAIHLVVRRNQEENMATDVSGSMLIFCVMDHKPSIVDNNIGSFPLNLAHMLSASCSMDQTMSKNVHTFGDEKDQRSNVHVMDLKQPLLKNAKQTGWMSCRIETWWAPEDDERIAKSLSASNVNADHLRRIDRRDGSSGRGGEAREKDLWIEEASNM